MLCAGCLLALREIVLDELIPIYVLGAAVAVGLSLLLRRSVPAEPVDPQVVDALRASSRVVLLSRAVRSRVPKSAPRREDSQAARSGDTKLTAARTIASLIRKAHLRETVIDICDCADNVLETIRRMPEDTPAAVTFVDTHLSKLTEALEKCYELSRSDSYKRAAQAIDHHELECFTMFCVAFSRQQDHILFEGMNKK